MSTGLFTTDRLSQAGIMTTSLRQCYALSANHHDVFLQQAAEHAR
ncbi:hypothetical protein ACPAVH_32925 [Enterobacteriaceae bacterium TYF_5]